MIVVDSSTVVAIFRQEPDAARHALCLEQADHALMSAANVLETARMAHARFGKGGGHPAQLNFGDCFAYALARALEAPLLFKGDDFIHTDLKGAL